MTRLLAPGLAALLFSFAAVASAQQDLAAARDLYASARYEDALVALDRLKDAGPASSLVVEQYRANCLLALNRRAEAEQAIETIVALDPFYVPAEDDVAPWVRTAFKETRRKVLPAALQRLFAHAKEAYARKAADDARTSFTNVLRLLEDPDLSIDPAAQIDVRMIAQGFLDLLHAAAPAPPPDGVAKPATPSPAVSAPVPAQEAPPAAANGAATAPDRVRDPKLFDATSADVVPPVPLKRDVPTWPYGPRPAPGTAIVVEIVVRESGSIESIVVRQGAGRFYDQMVIQAAQNWLYRPATKAGQPVRYRLLVKVVIGTPPAEKPSADEANDHLVASQSTNAPATRR